MIRLLLFVFVLQISIKIDCQTSKYYIFENPYNLDIYKLDTNDITYISMCKSFIVKLKKDISYMNNINIKDYIKVNDSIYSKFYFYYKVKLARSNDTIFFKPIKYVNDEFDMSFENNTCNRTQFVLNINKEVPYSDFNNDFDRSSYWIDICSSLCCKFSELCMYL